MRGGEGRGGGRQGGEGGEAGRWGGKAGRGALKGGPRFSVKAFGGIESWWSFPHMLRVKKRVRRTHRCTRSNVLFC